MPPATTPVTEAVEPVSEGVMVEPAAVREDEPVEDFTDMRR